VFIVSNSKIVNNIYQSLQSTKDLHVSSILYGEAYTGKKTLVKKLYPNSVWVDGSKLEDVLNALGNYSQIIITNYEKIANIDAINFNNSSVIAIYNKKSLDPRLENKFAFIYRMPPLSERLEDIELFTKYYTHEAQELFNLSLDVKLDNNDLDLSENFRSLKSSIYKYLLLKQLSDEDLNYTLENYFEKHYRGSNLYKEMLEVFEKPLLKVGLKLYKSQLKLADVLGINRNTLRKKINEYT